MEYEKIIGGIAAYWDERASTFDKDHDTEDLDAWAAALDELLGGAPRQSVVDAGAGSGFLANLLCAKGHAALAVDVAEAMMDNGVRHARAAGAPTFFMRGDAAELPLMPESVDAVVNARLLWTMAKPRRMLAEWMRVLRPGGRVLCFNRMDDEQGLTRWGEGVYDSPELDAALPLQEASFEQLEGLLASCGFEEVFCKKLPGLSYAGPDCQDWYVLAGRKPAPRTFLEEPSMAAYWDDAAERYDAGHELADEPRWAQVLDELVGGDKDQLVVDVATGTGAIANFLASAGYSRVVGIDIAEKMMRKAIDQARERGNGAVFRYGNAMQMPFESESVQAVVSSRLLWTLAEPDKALAEWHRVLKPGGVAVAINELEEEGIEVDCSQGYLQQTGAASLEFSQASREQILAAFERAGFQEVAVKPLKGCHMKTSDRENWFAFVGVKKPLGGAQ